MKKSALTFDEVSKEITEMLLSGEKITVRNVMAKVGGKTTTISDYLKRWHLQNDKNVSHEENTVGDEIIQAILTEKCMAITTAVCAYKTQIKYLDELVQELNGIISTKETQLTTKEDELKNIKEKLVVENAQFQAQKKSDELQIKELKQQLSNTQEKLEIASNGKHDAIKDAAVWKAKYEQLQQLQQLSQRTKK